MDGIFGVGVIEVLIVLLGIFVIGGPENTAKWAREAGVQVRKLREAWAKMMAEVEKELGPEGKEIMDVTRELSQSAREVRKMGTPQKRLLGETLRMVEHSVDMKEETNGSGSQNKSAAAKPPGANKSDGAQKYAAWLPPDSDPKDEA